MDRLRLVLVGVEGSINLGMIARLADNFDVDELYLVAPKASIAEAERYAARAARRLYESVIVGDIAEALQDVSLSICTSAHSSERDALRIPVAPWEAAEAAARTPGTVALVMGRESVGLTRREIAHCTLLSTIPASPAYPVLNLANATAIYLYELYKARHGPARGEPIDPEKLLLVEAYTRALAPRLAHREKVEELILTLRRIAGKPCIAPREAENLLYLLSRACRALGCSDEVSRYLQPGHRGHSSGGDRVGSRRGEHSRG